MLKIFGGAVIALVLGSTSALAVQYDCQFATNDVIKKYCTINTTSPATSTCEYKISNTLMATCAGNDILVGCAFHNGPLTAGELASEFGALAWPSGGAAIEAAKGFQAVSVGSGVAVIGLVEKTGAPRHAAACSG